MEMFVPMQHPNVKLFNLLVRGYRQNGMTCCFDRSSQDKIPWYINSMGFFLKRFIVMFDLKKKKDLGSLHYLLLCHKQQKIEYGISFWGPLHRKRA